MKLVFAERAWGDYLHWRKSDPNILERLNGLIRECTRTPFQGTGKPEPLKGDLNGWRSRRVTLEDRSVYRVDRAVSLLRLGGTPASMTREVCFPAAVRGQLLAPLALPTSL